MPAANGWAKGNGVGPIDLYGIEHGREEERQRIEHDGVGDRSDLELQERANKPFKNLGEWPLATSPIGPGVAGEGLGVPSL
mgnify:CR=1 FL=1